MNRQTGVIKRSKHAWRIFAAGVVIAFAVAVVTPSVMAVDYSVGSSGTYANLQALRTAVPTLGDDRIIFTDAGFTDNSLAAAFSIANGATLTFVGTGTIAANNNNIRFINDTSKTFTLLVEDDSLITLSGFGTTSSGGAILGGVINLGTTGNNGTFIFENNSAIDSGAIDASRSDLNITGGTVRFTSNSAGFGGVIHAHNNNVLLRATDGDFLFCGNTASGKANAIYVSNMLNHTITLAAEDGRKIEFFDPITSSDVNGYTNTHINPISDDTGTILFDGSYWLAQGKNPTDDQDYFATRLYGTATLSYGTLKFTNSAIYDGSGTILNVKSDATLITEIYQNAGVWTSNLTTDSTGMLVFEDGATWYVREDAAFGGGDVAGIIVVDDDGKKANAALALGNTRNALYEFLYSKSKEIIYTATKVKGCVSDTIVNTPLMFQPQLSFVQNGCAAYRGNQCRPVRGDCSLWANYSGRYTELVANSDISCLAGMSKITSDGIQFGADHFVAERTIFGVLFNYERGFSALNTSRMTGDNYSFAFYGTHQFAGDLEALGDFDVLAFFGYGHQRYDSRRYDITALEFRHANFAGNTFEMTLEGGYRMLWDKNIWLRPAIALDLFNNDIENFTEYETDGLTFGKMSLTHASVRVGGDLLVKRNRLFASGGVYYSHQMSESGNLVRTTAAIGSAERVNIWGSDLGRNKLTMNAGGAYTLGANRTASVFGGYTSDYFTDRAGKPWGHNYYAGLRWAF